MEERPLECSKCKKKADVIYTEIMNGTATTLHMCSDCPFLQSKLPQVAHSPLPSSLSEEEKNLSCPFCHTTIESVMMGNLLGCKECYTVFQKILIEELIETGSVAPRLKPEAHAMKTTTLHIGKSPYFAKEDASRLHELHTALSDAIQGENYEQAAWIRDQIQELTKPAHE
jgi:protein arginine kinase activator